MFNEVLVIATPMFCIGRRWQSGVKRIGEIASLDYVEFAMTIEL